MEQVCVGVDIGGTSVKLGIFTLNGDLLKKWEYTHLYTCSSDVNSYAYLFHIFSFILLKYYSSKVIISKYCKS